MHAHPACSAFAGETITGAAYRLHQVLVGFAERLAQPADMHIDGALFYIDIAAPDLIEQLAAGVGAFLVGPEELQQAVCGWTHLGRLPADSDAVDDRVGQHAADPDRRFEGHWRGAA